jgi:hypothetical protein
MMKRPEPKAEIVVVQHGELLKITTASQDAAAWIEQEAQTFFGTFSFSDGRGIACVRDTYDPAEVAAYLMSYNSR